MEASGERVKRRGGRNKEGERDGEWRKEEERGGEKRGGEHGNVHISLQDIPNKAEEGPLE